MGEAGQLGLFQPSLKAPRNQPLQVPGMKYPCWTALLSDGRLFRSEDQLPSYQLRKP